MIIGHQKQWHFLKKSAELSRISHAYLFFGPAQLGKRTLAIEFIKFLDCQDPDYTVRPCQKCPACQDIKKGQHPDLIFIGPLIKEIQISQIRELQWKLSLRPSIASIKAAILDQAHLMNSEAQSCFLKTLEEPSGKTVIILITEHPELLFPTIISRIQKIKFFPLSGYEIESYIKKQGISPKEAKKITFFSSGKPGRTINFISDPQKLENQDQRIKELTQIIQSDLNYRFQYIKDLVSQKQNLKEVLDIWLRYFRNILLTKINNREPLINIQKNYPLVELKKIINTITNIDYLLSSTNVNSRLALEQIILEL